MRIKIKCMRPGCKGSRPKEGIRGGGRRIEINGGGVPHPHPSKMIKDQIPNSVLFFSLLLIYDQVYRYSRLIRLPHLP